MRVVATCHKALVGSEDALQGPTRPLTETALCRGRDHAPKLTQDAVIVDSIERPHADRVGEVTPYGCDFPGRSAA